MMKPFELLSRLAAAAQPSGFEGPQAAILAELARPFADEVYTDLLGNVICHKKGPGKRVMIPAHMDVLGLLIIDVDDRGYLRFEPLGGHAPFQLVGTTVRLESGAPEYRFSGGSARWMDEHHLRVKLSLSHDSGMALAFCILETET